MQYSYKDRRILVVDDEADIRTGRTDRKRGLHAARNSQTGRLP